MSEYERPDRATREPTVEDVRQLMGASTPHFALQLRNRIATLIADLPAEHPARVEGEREISRLDNQLASESLEPMDDRMRDVVAPQRLSTVLAGGFAAIALLLASVGLYGLVAYTTAQRRRQS